MKNILDKNRYLFLNENLTCQKDSIQPGPRILSYDNTKIHLPNSFVTIEELKKNDLEFNELKKINPKRANLITRDEFFFKLDDLIFVSTKEKVDSQNDYLLLLHTISGKIINNKEFTGLHYIRNPKPDFIILENVGKPDKNDVWKADIKIIRNGKELFKSVPSTIFPKSWNFQRVYNECIYAINNREFVKSMKKINIYRSFTEIGVPVEIRYDKNGKFKTIFPLYGYDKS